MNTPTKVCTKCNVEKPLTPEFYHRKRSYPDGFNTQCKTCINDYRKQWLKNNPDKAERQRQYAKAYYENNKEKHAKQCKQWRVNNAEKWKRINYENVQQWRKDNPDKQKELSRRESKRWRKNNPDKVAKQHRKWQLKNPHKNRAKARRYWVRKHDAQGQHTANDVLQILRKQRGQCAYCLDVIGQDYEVDHIVPLIQGGTDEPFNLCCACKSCNSSKSGKLLSEWDKYDPEIALLDI